MSASAASSADFALRDAERRLREAEEEHAEVLEEIYHDLRKIREDHGPGPHRLSNGRVVLIKRNGKPKFQE